MFPGQWAHHVNSIFHKEGARIRALLAANCLTQTEIAKRVGLTRERIRQIAKKIGFPTGREREKVCRLNKLEVRSVERLEAFWEKPINKALKERCKELGLSVDAEFVFPSKINSVNGHIEIFVEGRRCHVLRMTTESRGKYVYGRIMNRSENADFYLRYYDKDGSWWIFPNDSRFSTTFSLNPIWGMPAHWYDYRKHKEAWHLLKG
jgi:transcriptional regulator with XRE-family HTH domain